MQRGVFAFEPSEGPSSLHARRSCGPTPTKACNVAHDELNGFCVPGKRLSSGLDDGAAALPLSHDVVVERRVSHDETDYISVYVVLGGCCAGIRGSIQLTGRSAHRGTEQNGLIS